MDIGAYESPYLFTKTGLTSSAGGGTSNYGQSVTFTATVSVVDGGTGVPTGSAEFFDGSKDLGAGTKLAGSGASASSTLAISTLGVAPHSIKAVYMTTGNFLGSASGTVGQTVLPAMVTVVIQANNKVYDGTTATTLRSATLTGVIGTDSVTQIIGSVAFADRNAATGKTVTATGLALGGPDAGKYKLSSVTATTTANIAQASVTAALTASNKVYDATTAAALSSEKLVGVIGTDAVGLKGGTATFADRSVGNGKTVTATGLVLSGADTGNYQLASATATATANITPAPLTITAASESRTYDGTTAAAATPAVAGLKGTDTVTGLSETFNNKDVGTGKALSVATGYTINDGNGGKDYTVTDVASTGGTIHAAPLTITAASESRTYDGTTASTTAPLVVGLKGNDTVTGLSETFNNKDVGTGKALSVATGYTINDGNGGKDYTVTAVASITSGVITAAPLAVAGVTAASKAYDGTTTAALNTAGAKLVGVFNGDEVTLQLAAAAGTFASPHPGNPVAVTVAGLSIAGDQAPDYSLSQPSASASIMPAVAVLSVSAPGGTYNGSRFPASVTVAASVGANTPAASLEDVAPVLTYYVGSSTSGTDLGTSPPAAPGTTLSWPASPAAPIMRPCSPPRSSSPFNKAPRRSYSRPQAARRSTASRSRSPQWCPAPACHPVP